MTSEPVHRPSSAGRLALFVGLAALAMAVDQVTKALAQLRLADGRSHTLIRGILSLRLIRNPGASLGMGAGHTWIISLLAAAACIIFIVLAIRTTSYRWTVVLSLALAGAAGNLTDRIAYAGGFLDGAVVDFLDYGWSIGNIADIFLTLAGVAVVVMILAEVPFREGSPDPVTGKRPDGGGMGAGGDAAI